MTKWCLPILLSTLSVFPAHAEEPAWKSEITSPAPGPHPVLVPTVLDFTLSWEGMIDAGKLRIEFAPPDSKKPDAYVVRASASSVGAAAALFPYKGNFWSELNPTALKPRFLNTIEIDQKENVSTTVRYFADHIESHEDSKLLKTGVTKSTDKLFKFAPVFDIFSAMLHVRSQKLDDGDQIAIVVCPFSTPYILKVKVQAHETHNGRDAIRLTLGMRKIDRDTLELKTYKKLKKDATMWLSDDADRVPIEFRADAFIGDVRATLTSNRKP